MALYHQDLIDLIARSDSEFDGRISKDRSFEQMARHDRDRYRERAAKSLRAIAEHCAIVPREPDEATITADLSKPKTDP